MNQEKCVLILKILKDYNTQPVTHLKFSSPFELLISTMLSSQSTDHKVNKVTANLYSKANTPNKILTLGIDKIKEYLKPLGLYNIKAKNIIGICDILINKYNGQVPDNRSDLEKLPGVGRKTANIILNIIFKHSTIAVDTHVFRVSNRTRLAIGKNVKQVERELLKLIPLSLRIDCHYLLMNHGRYICKARKPNCRACVIFNLCENNKKFI